MSEIIGVCGNPRCKAVFTVPNLFSIKGQGSLTLDHIGTNCPKCGGSARILPGTFTGSDSGSPVFSSGPAETTAAVSYLRKIIDDAKAGKDAEEILSELEGKSQKLGQIARNIVARKGIVFLIAALSYLLAACDAKL